MNVRRPTRRSEAHPYMNETPEHPGRCRGVAYRLVDMVGIQYVAERRNGRMRSYRIDGDWGSVGSGPTNLGACL